MSTQPFTLNFIKNQRLLQNGDSATLQVTPPDPSLVPTLALNPFPRQQINFMNVNASAAGQTDLAFLTERGNVGFQGSANASAAVSVFPSGADAVSALQLDADVPLNLNLPDDAPGQPTHYDLVRFGIAADASVSGKVALGAGGAVTFGADASATAISAVIERFADGVLVGGVELADTLGNWVLPSQVDGPARLDPGTWVVAEVEGSLNLSLGAQYGLNYNWVRNTKIGGLSGDIGLKLQLGISAALGFNIGGKYAVAVSRESLDQANQTLRVRVYKLSTHGFDFAFDAGVSARADTSGLTPDNVDDFLKAVLGVHGAQIVKDLETLDKWTGSQQTLSGLLAQAGNNYVLKLVKDLTGVDPATAFDTAKTQVQNFVTKWTNLNSINHDLVTRLLNFVEKGADLTPIKQAAQFLANGDSSALQTLLASALPQAGFAQTPLAQYLESAASSTILALLQGGPAFQEAQKSAAAVLGILDGSTIESILNKYEQRLEATLGLTDLIQAVNNGLQQADFNKLDGLLQAKLAALVDKAINELGLSDLDTIRKAIGAFIGKRQSIYDTAIKALNHTYKAELTASYEATSTGTALLDIEFDFSQEDAAGTLSKLLRQAIDGKFSEIVVGSTTFNLLEDSIPGVTLHQGSLSHNIRRHSHVEISLPYFQNVADHMNSGNADFTVDKDANRVFVSATVSEFQKNRYRRDSTLAIMLQFDADATGQIQIHDKTSFSYSYQLRLSRNSMSTQALSNQIQPYVGSYFTPLFGDGSRRLGVNDMLNGISAAVGGGGTLTSQTLVSMDISVPTVFTSAWFTPPQSDGDEQARLDRLSRAVQTAMRHIVPYMHFQDLSKFTLQADCSAFLLYAACPPQSDINSLTNLPQPIMTAVTAPRAKDNLKSILQAISNIPGVSSDFALNNIDLNLTRIIGDATSNPLTLNALRAFFGMDASIISKATKARQDVLKFQANFDANPDAAIHQPR